MTEEIYMHGVSQEALAEGVWDAERREGKRGERERERKRERVRGGGGEIIPSPPSSLTPAGHLVQSPIP